jgi:hypothetical protein
MSNMSEISNLVIPISAISNGRLFFFLFRCCFSSSNYFFNLRRLSSGMKHFHSLTSPLSKAQSNEPSGVKFES